MAVKTLADAHGKLTILTTEPVNMKAITVAELSAGIDASCQVAKNGTRFSATASSTSSDSAWCDDLEVTRFTQSNYEGMIAPFWYLDAATGAYAAADNAVYEAARVRDTRLWFVMRDGPRFDQAWASGDVYDVYEAITDNPQRPSETGTSIKRQIPLAIHRAEIHQTVAAGT